MFFSYYDAFTGELAAHRGAILALLAVLYILAVIGSWKLFEKAGVPGWKALIPVYSSYKMFDLMWGDGYFFLFSLIPYFGFVFHMIMLYKTAKAFGKEGGFMAGLVLLPTVFRLLLAFGPDRYIGPDGVDPENNPYKINW